MNRFCCAYAALCIFLEIINRSLLNCPLYSSLDYSYVSHHDGLPLQPLASHPFMYAPQPPLPDASDAVDSRARRAIKPQRVTAGGGLHGAKRQEKPPYSYIALIALAIKVQFLRRLFVAIFSY